MGNWLVSYFTIFGIQAQNWMLVAVAIVAIAAIISWRFNR